MFKQSFMSQFRAILTKVIGAILTPAQPVSMPEGTRYKMDLPRMNGTPDGSVLYAVRLDDIDATSTARMDTMASAVRYARRHYPGRDWHIVQVNAPVPPANPRVPYGSRRWSGAERVNIPVTRPVNGEQRPYGAIDIHPDGDFYSM